MTELSIGTQRISAKVAALSTTLGLAVAGG